MSKSNKNLRLYEYTYQLVDRWGEVVEESTGDILAEDMVDAVDRAIQTVQHRNLKAYDFEYSSVYVDILDIHLTESER